MKNWLKDIQLKEITQFVKEKINNKRSYDNFYITLKNDIVFGPLVEVHLEYKNEEPVVRTFFQFGELVKSKRRYELKLKKLLNSNFLYSIEDFDWVSFVNKQNFGKTIHEKTYLQSYSEFVKLFFKTEKIKMIKKLNKKYKSSQNDINSGRLQVELKVLYEKIKIYEDRIREFLSNSIKNEKILKKD